jgi:hypothetical protein
VIEYLALVVDQPAEAFPTPLHRFTLLAIADTSCHDGGECWMRLRSVTRYTGQDQSDVQQHLADLVAEGWLDPIEPDDTPGVGDYDYGFELNVERLERSALRCRPRPAEVGE